MSLQTNHPVADDAEHDRVYNKARDQRHHLGEVVGIGPVYPVLILSQEQRQFLGEDVKDSVERRECIFGDEDEEDALDVLDAGLVQRDVGVANTHKEGNENFLHDPDGVNGRVPVGVDEGAPREPPELNEPVGFLWYTPEEMVLLRTRPRIRLRDAHVVLVLDRNVDVLGVSGHGEVVADPLDPLARSMFVPGKDRQGVDVVVGRVEGRGTFVAEAVQELQSTRRGTHVRHTPLGQQEELVEHGEDLR